ncbi:MAG: HlyD family efflux transporter periplasmic adaptor subunit [Beijerinckiaceae bacterium]
MSLAQAHGPGQKPVPLPVLREDIRLLKDAASPSGAPRWLIHDPVRDSFFEIGIEAFQLISLWSSSRTVDELAKRASEQTGRIVSETEVTKFAHFLGQMRLTLDATGGWRELSGSAASAKHGIGHQLLHNYLFFKLPLVQPTAFLQATLPIARIFASKGILVLYVVLTLIGVYFASRQWGDIVDGVQRQFNLSGALLFAVTLFVMKIFHELGHAYVATAVGIRVRSMGIAVMMMAPMLYTDVTEAWRLQDKRKRMAIDLAGVAVEMVIAGLALLAWAFLPPGDGRDIALVITTAAVAATLAVNLSPFMRFDGYYVLADFIGVKNLQPRAFALVRWKMREWLFNIGAACPDSLRGGLRTFVIAYGIVTMIYRLMLFIGIAVVVYYMTFKILGILLFLVEIGVFVAMPIWREVKVWWSLKDQIFAETRIWFGISATVIVLGLAAIPWSTTVKIPAVLEPAQFVRLYPTSPAEIREVHVRPGQMVKEGEILLVLASTKLDKELSVTQARLELVNQRIGRRLGDSKDQASSLPLEKDRLSLIERRDSLQRQISQLSIRATLDGRIAELDPDLHVGRLISREDEIGIIIGGNQTIIRGFADQQDIWRLRTGQSGRFIPDDTQAGIVRASLSQIALSASPHVDIPHLAETNGGLLRTHPPQPKMPLVPIDPIHQVTLQPQNYRELGSQPIRGVAIVEGSPQSMVASLWRRVLKVLVQEAGA